MSEKLSNFTKDFLHKIEPPQEKRAIYKDSKEAGLILIVSYGGTKTFYVGKKINKLYHGIVIGRFLALSVVEARAKAAELKSQIARGINPMGKKLYYPMSYLYPYPQKCLKN